MIAGNLSKQQFYSEKLETRLDKTREDKEKNKRVCKESTAFRSHVQVVGKLRYGWRWDYKLHRDIQSCLTLNQTIDPSNSVLSALTGSDSPWIEFKTF